MSNALQPYKNGPYDVTTDVLDRIAADRNLILSDRKESETAAEAWVENGNYYYVFEKMTGALHCYRRSHDSVPLSTEQTAGYQ